MVRIAVDVLSNLLPGMVDTFDARVQDALDVAVVTAIETADPQTRVDTGALRANKVIDRDDESRTVHWVMEYAAFQNSGTTRMSGTHFADRGADAGMDRLASELRRLF